MKYTVALTGGIGSGKTTVSNFFAKLGVIIIDADIIAREIVAPGSYGLSILVEKFGQAILQPDGTLDRGHLRNMMFGETDKHIQTKEMVNQILHPLIAKETQLQIANATSPYVLWVVPLLFENRLQKKANRILVVDVPESVQIARTINRDNVSKTQVEQILKSQASRKTRLSLADDVIYGDEMLETIEKQVILLHQKYLEQAYQTSEHTSRINL
ncbi:dephospho-CoA kinase [Thorsellia anophelis]|uniref:Dephospho-CoA kinase n=1 Tax=Thorsellia anophelis DSM 18579 TaxID=1123402 RepID=A0A1H9YCI4_9GAMM|nr:dephospho-CoA kinase [Thorsellia anophelis]SES66645.1 dephospho-CoA kinase [Thorsellia anophelis DSM 18579]